MRPTNPNKKAINETMKTSISAEIRVLIMGCAKIIRPPFGMPCPTASPLMDAFHSTPTGQSMILPVSAIPPVEFSA